MIYHLPYDAILSIERSRDLFVAGADETAFDPTGLAAAPGGRAVWYADRERKRIGRIALDALQTPMAPQPAGPTPAGTLTPAGQRLYLTAIVRNAGGA